MATTSHVDLPLGEVVIRFSGHYTKADPGVHTLPNGDPGYPGTPSEFAWETAHLLLDEGRKSLEVTDFIYELLNLGHEELASALLEAYEDEVEAEDDEPSEDDIADFRRERDE